MEEYLRNYVTKQQNAWIKWLHFREYCYHTTHHMSIGMSPFKALYGYKETSFGSLILYKTRAPGAKDFVQQNMDTMNTLKDNLHHAQNQKKLMPTETKPKGHLKLEI